MQRRKFIKQIAFLTGGLLVAGEMPASVLTGKRKKLKGRVFSNGRGIKGVVVSDGYSVVVTDKRGDYELDPHPGAVTIFVSTPAGYAFAHENGISRHYRLLKETAEARHVDFELAALDKDDHEHQFIIWADPQVKNAKDIEKMMTQSVPDVQKFVAAAGAGTLLHGITVGDIVWDELQLYPEYNKAVEKMGIPFFQCLGNHDMDYNKGGDDASDDTFQQTFGPTYYSFNRGEAHYVVMDNVRYLGKDRQYDGFFMQNQLDWLQKDLSVVPNDKLVVLCVHIPVHEHTKNSADLYAILGDRNVHIMSGHTHYHKNIVNGNIYEHNHGTVCGAWWTGPICQDGTPNGYGIYKVKGKELEWHYQSTGYEADHQFKVFVENEGDNKKIVANIWNYDAGWKNDYWIDGEHKGMLEQFTSIDPLANTLLLGPDLPKPRGFAEPRTTDHLFKAMIPTGAKEIRIRATDRFGKEFTVTQTLTV